MEKYLLVFFIGCGTNKTAIKLNDVIEVELVVLVVNKNLSLNYRFPILGQWQLTNSL